MICSKTDYTKYHTPCHPIYTILDRIIIRFWSADDLNWSGIVNLFCFYGQLGAYIYTREEINPSLHV